MFLQCLHGVLRIVSQAPLHVWFMFFGKCAGACHVSWFRQTIIVSFQLRSSSRTKVLRKPEMQSVEVIDRAFRHEEGALHLDALEVSPFREVDEVWL